ncbi:hypothetical protein [Arsukibacterium sp.]|uniref:hypothetical protein n=1 Tax=Arsukibacterium sp. TaxID=1977258 RepID=UPI002FD9E56B
MFSVVWEVRSETESADLLVDLYGITAKFWNKGDHISASRQHTTSGFRVSICDCEDLCELHDCISAFIDKNSEVLSYIKNRNFSSEIDIGVVVDHQKVAMMSLQLPLDIQVKLSEKSVSLIYTVMLADD